MKYLTQLFFTILVLSDALYLPSCVFFSIYVVISFMYLDHALALCMAKSTPACNLSKMESISSGFIAVRYQKKYHSCMYHWASIQSIQFFLCKTLQQCKFASRILFPSLSAKTFLKSLQDENSCSFFVMEYFPVKLLLHQPALLMIDEADNGFIS